MYYLNCVCTLLNLDDHADINRLRKYNNYDLSEDQTDRLIALCYLLRYVQFTNNDQTCHVAKILGEHFTFHISDKYLTN